jgi:hypothetical protein
LFEREYLKLKKLWIRCTLVAGQEKFFRGWLGSGEQSVENGNLGGVPGIPGGRAVRAVPGRPGIARNKWLGTKKGL